MSERKLLLDTHALIWLIEGVKITQPALSAIEQASLGGGLYVSPISAWEIGMLCYPRRGDAGLVLAPDPRTWFTDAMEARFLKVAPLTVTAAMDSRTLPGDLHGDPADRMLVATAREMGAPMVTRDRKLLAYAAAGHMQVLPC